MRIRSGTTGEASVEAVAADIASAISSTTPAWSGRAAGAPRDEHVRVADGLDLLQAALLGERVKTAEDLVQECDHPSWRLSGNEGRQVDGGCACLTL